MTAESVTNESVLLPGFFTGSDFFIDEKIMVFKFRNEYRIYDALANPIGGIVQKKIFSYKLLRIFFKKTILPFTFFIVDENHNTLITIKRGWTLILSRIVITDKDGSLLGYIRQKFRMIKPRFKIYDADRRLIAEINGDWKAWNFVITDKHHISIGAIDKQWNGIRRELFTTSDKYHVSVLPDISQRDKKLIIATAVTIDRILKESR
jgi:uncharacterized protein YxjI